MLIKFSVKNYKQFKDEITFDLSAGNYTFNEECVKNGVVKTALIYGANGTGKTSIGWAMFDLVEHLTNNSPLQGKATHHFANALTREENIEFLFTFILLGSEVIYQYHKNNKHIIQREKLIIDNEVIVDYEMGKPFTTNLQGTESLNKELNKSQNLSTLRYIFNNSSLDIGHHNVSVFIALMDFIENAVWFQSVTQGMSFVGKYSGDKEILSRIVTSGKLEDFESFLNANGVRCRLKPIEYIGGVSIAFDFDGYHIPFLEIASTGTKHLATFYFWWIETQERNVSLLFLDEFDSAYHFKLSKNIVNKLKELPNTQVILTTHNTNLLNNDLIRPDCGFIINGKKIQALHKSTIKELRFAHNLEKMYKAGGFHV